jgi:hypothetical protein
MRREHVAPRAGREHSSIVVQLDVSARAASSKQVAACVEGEAGHRRALARPRRQHLHIAPQLRVLHSSASVTTTAAPAVMTTGAHACRIVRATRARVPAAHEAVRRWPGGARMHAWRRRAGKVRGPRRMHAAGTCLSGGAQHTVKVRQAHLRAVRVHGAVVAAVGAAHRSSPRRRRVQRAPQRELLRRHALACVQMPWHHHHACGHSPMQHRSVVCRLCRQALPQVLLLQLLEMLLYALPPGSVLL